MCTGSFRHPGDRQFHVRRIDASEAEPHGEEEGVPLTRLSAALRTENYCEVPSNWAKTIVVTDGMVDSGRRLPEYRNRAPQGQRLSQMNNIVMDAKDLR